MTITKTISLLLAVATMTCSGWSPCEASALTVSPISLSMLAPAQSVALTLRNRDTRPLNVQVRVFRWTQDGGEDRLEPTDDVAASPPIVEVAAGGASAVRLQRVVEGSPAGEDAYRVVVDEIPDLNRQRNGAVNVLLRYSVPMFVVSPDAAPAHLTWSMRSLGAKSAVEAGNDGDKHLQLSNLTLRSKGRSWPVAPGLSGYVLGHARRSWEVRGVPPSARPLRVTATSDLNAVDASVLP